ncbi:RHS repeat-associated core domain-containing protein [Salinispora sp. H7-4]|uniref:RHS repeat-associated core domain-containing protein n=1 Tax=Salinispora sp. H7-4 TaxID=2748321 RepID=UPI002106742B|nr:RHS repeat-associated core domain-containing protein [Salinispora sp. H7-4]
MAAAVLVGLLPVVQLGEPVAADPVAAPDGSVSVAGVGVPEADQGPDPDDRQAVTEPLPAAEFPAGGEAVLDLEGGAADSKTFGLTVERAEGPAGLRVERAEESAEEPAGVGALDDSVAVDEVDTVRVRWFDRAASEGLGSAGPLFTLRRADGGAASGAVRVELDYSAYAQAYGGSFADRLTLVRLPECAATLPEVAQCSARPQWVSSVNDPAAETLTAVVDVGGDLRGAGRFTGAFAGESADSMVAPAGVFAVMASASGGSTGSYTATDLKESGSWQVGASAGSFSYSYPLPEPSLPYGQTLGLEVSYNSSSVDGMTHGTNNQSGPVGLGWTLSPGFIEREYKPCPAHPSEMCWESPDDHDGESDTNDQGSALMTISLHGQSTKLVKTTSGVWKTVDDLGWRVEFLSGGAENDGYWKVWTQDGTEYRFGHERDSVWKMSFLGDEAGEPCHGSYPSSCRDPWRWNLDRVSDPNENDTTLVWKRETNHYKRALTGSILEYDRGGYLAEVRYAKNMSEEGAIPVGRTVFSWASRCVERTAEEDPLNNTPPSCPSTSSSPSSYPDVPTDLSCGSSSCSNYTQSFFSTRILDRVTSYQWNAGSGAWNNVGRVQLRYKVVNPPGLTDRVFILDYIRPVGLIGLDTNKVDLPPVNFDYVDGVQPNYRDGRVDYDEAGLGVSAMRMPRLLVVRNGLGGRTEVTYGTQRPCPQGGSNKSGYDTWHDGKVGDWDVNTQDCYPIFHTPPGAEAGFGIFHKYLVKKVVVKDQVGDSPDQVTQYDYSVGTPAWKTLRSPLIPNEHETWNLFAGYDQVRVVQGTGTDPSTYTVSTSTYFRGMYHDFYDPGSGGGIKETKITDWAGNTYHDHYARAGLALQTRQYRMTTYNANPAKAGYAEVASTRYDHEIQGSLDGPGWWNPRQVNPGLENHRVRLDDGSWRETSQRTIYDSTYGLPIRLQQYNQVGVDDNTCTSYTYAQRDEPNSWYLIDYPERVETWSGDTCGSGTLLSRTVTFYDSYTVEGSQRPFDGNVAEVHTYHDPTSYVSSGRSTYDNMGRLVTSTDATGLTTTTSYSPAINWPDNGITSTVGGGFNHTTTTHISRYTGEPSKLIDQNGKVTELRYDPVGRLAEVYLPGQAKSSGVPSLRFDYHLTSSGIGQPTAAARIRTETLQSHNGSPVYLSSYQYLDGLGRARESQQPGPNGGRVVTATTYDPRGNIAATTQPFHNSADAGNGLVNPDLTTVPAVQETRYDHLNRPTTVVDKKLGAGWRQTTNTYYGDRNMVVPPSGGTKTVSHHDVRGNTTRVDQYASASDPDAYQSTTYTYDRLNQLTALVDPAGNTWTSTYDLAGRLTGKTDPDAGASSTHYDTVGRVAHTIDARGQKISTEYDGMSRTKALWSGEVNTGERLTSYLYDSIAKGQPTATTRWHNGNAYTTAVTGYTDRYQPSGTTVTIPTAEGALAGTYTSSTAYDLTGKTVRQTLPGIGGLPAETITTEYDTNGYLQSTTGQIAGAPDIPYLAETAYYLHGPVHHTLHGNPGSQIRRTNTIDTGTGRLDNHDVATEDPATPGTFTSRFTNNYTYDPAGNITAIAGQTDGITDQTECFTYDQLRRLTQAWTQNTATCTDPQRSGADPYHRSWTFDDLGNRLTQTDHNDTTGNTTWTYNVGTSHGTTAHQVASITATGPQAETPIRAFTYDDAGSTLTRTTPTGDTQNLTWNLEGRLDNLTDNNGTTSYIYDAAGNRLITHAPDKTTLYLGGTELELPTGSTQANGTRYYNGNAVRTTSGLTWTINNHQNTSQIQIDADTLTTQRRRTMPYGENRTTPPTPWIGTKGYVGGTTDPTGLTHLGAREYDPTLGRFISVDPIMDLADPQQWHGYAYSNNNPTTFSDPSGLKFLEGEHESDGRVAFKWHGKTQISGRPPSRRKSPKTSLIAGNDIFRLTKNSSGELELNGVPIPAGPSEDVIINEIVSYCNDPRGGVANCENALACSYVYVEDCADQWAHGALDVMRGAMGGEFGAAYDEALYGTLEQAIQEGFIRYGWDSEGRLGGGSYMGRPFRGCGLRSFAGDTEVLLADGSTKPIKDIEVGDLVWATDPQTGYEGPREVTHLWVHEDQLVDLRVDGGDVTTTEDHPFWNETDRQWQDSQDLDPGDLLHTAAGQTLAVVGLDWVTTQRGMAYNLTVADIHTYYVLAGDTPVLVHNTGGCDFDLEGIQHARDRHLKDGKDWDPNAGYFGKDEDFGALARGSAGQIGIRQENGNIKYVINAGRVVGIDKGKETTFYTVIRDPYGGDLVTMFPGRG